MWTKVIFSFFLLIALTSANHLSVVGPLISKDGITYKSYVASDEFTHEYDAAVYFSCNGSTSRQLYNLKSGSSLAEEVTLELRDPFFGSCTVGSVMRPKDTNFCYSDSISVINHPSSIIMIQTDKPMYKPNDLVRYQIVAINDQTLPFKLTKVDVEIYDGNDVLISTTTSTKEITRPEYGFHQGELRLAEDPSLGVWTIRVKVNDEEKETRKIFSVKRYTLPPFKVFIDAPAQVAYRDHSFVLDISSEYSFGAKVVGTARINIFLMSNQSPSRNLSSIQMEHEVDGELKLEINFKEDLKMRFLIAPVTVIVDVEFEEENTEIISTASRRISVVPIKKYDFEITRRPKFIPGLTYHIGVLVKSVTSEAGLRSYELPMTLKYMFQQKEEETFGDKTVMAGTVEYDEHGGKVKFEIETTEDHEQLRLDFTYDGEEFSVEVSKDICGDENIQILVEKDTPIVGDGFTFTVEASKDAFLSALNVLVLGRSGLIYSKFHAEANEKNNIELSIPITKEMAPEADLVVFYLRSSDGTPVYDTAKISLAFVCDSQLTITTSDEIQKPGAKVTIKAEAEPKTLVSILGGDLALSFLGIGNLITESYLEESLAFNIKTYNFKKNPKQKGFGEINGFAIAPMSQKKHTCTELENEMLKSKFDGRSGSDTEIPVSKTIGEDKPDSVRKNFPEIWIYDIQEVDDSRELTWDLTLPDSITTWMLSGFGLHQEQCLAIAETQKIVVQQNFFLKLEAPPSIQYGESVDVKVIVYNYLNISGNATVTLYNRKNQYTFVSGDIDSQSLVTFVEMGKTASVTFTIHPTIIGTVFLNVDGILDFAKDEIEGTLLVNTLGMTRFKTFQSAIDLTQKRELPAIEWDFKIPNDHIKDTVKCEATASNTLISPPPNITQNPLPELPKGCGEQKMLKLAIAITIKRYLQATHQKLKESEEKELQAALDKGYQELITLQLKGSGAFDLWSKNSAVGFLKRGSQKNKEYFDLTIFIVRLMGLYKDIKSGMPVQPIDRAMKYIVSKQRKDGSFKNEAGNPQFRDLLQYSKNDGIALTAHTLIAILESEYLKDKHMATVNKSLSFLNNNFAKILNEGTDYERALLFYVYTLAGKDYQDILDKLYESAIVDGDKMYWQVNVKNKYPISLKIETSAYVALAFGKISKYNESMPILKFIANEQNAYGGFTTTTDTALALQAFSEIAKSVHFLNTNFDIILTNQIGEALTIKVLGSNTTQQYLSSLSPATRKLSVTAKGFGMGQISVTCSYDIKLTATSTYFDITTKAEKTGSDTINVEVCTNSKKGETDMALMEIKLPSGFSYQRGPIEELNDLKRTEVVNDNTKIFLYFEKLTEDETCVTIEAKKMSKVGNIQPASVIVSDFYDQEKIGFSTYSIKH